MAEMKRLPGAVYVVDPRKEHIAVTEARKLGIPIVAITAPADLAIELRAVLRGGALPTGAAGLPDAVADRDRLAQILVPAGAEGVAGLLSLSHLRTRSASPIREARWSLKNGRLKSSVVALRVAGQSIAAVRRPAACARS